MLATPRLETGAPGVYLLDGLMPPVLNAEPLDVAAFVGVAPRGPAWEPVDDPTLIEQGISRARSVAVAVDSWNEYVERFGAFEGPGLLPHAVAAYFAQGGRRAVVVRIVAGEIRRVGAEMIPLGCAHVDLVDPRTVDPGAAPESPPGVQPVTDTAGAALRLRARNEGTWGDRLAVRLWFETHPLPVTDAEPTVLVLDRGATVAVGALVRARGAGGTTALRWVQAVKVRGLRHEARHVTVAVLDQPLGFTPTRVEVVEAVLDIADRDPLIERGERFERLGLRVDHPRWLADVVRSESRLVEAPIDGVAVTDHALPALVARPVRGVAELEARDRWPQVTPRDVFGQLLVGDDAGTEGLDALVHAPEVASIVVPDLYSPKPSRPHEPVDIAGTSAGPAFAPCVEVAPERHPAPPAAQLTGLFRDPSQPAGLDQIVALQSELLQVAERLRLVALLDVPPGLNHAAVLRWRSRFDSSWAAAYHPWLRVPVADGDRALVEVNPSAVAAGIIARCERRDGVPRGPANEPLAQVVALAAPVNDRQHADLHRRHVNVARQAPDAVRLTAARTLSGERAWRQLSVRRLVQLIERAVGRQLLWTVFEPNDHALRAGLHRMVDHLLGDLFARGAFAGATPGESWFVHVAEGREVALEADRGQLVVEIGVAPSEPTEFIAVRFALDADGRLDVRSWLSTGVTVDG